MIKKVIKNSVLRGIVERTNSAVVTMSEALQSIVVTVIELSGVDETCDLIDLLEATMEIMLDMLEGDCLSEEEYLGMCRECTYLIMDGDLQMLIA